MPSRLASPDIDDKIYDAKKKRESLREKGLIRFLSPMQTSAYRTMASAIDCTRSSSGAPNRPASKHILAMSSGNTLSDSPSVFEQC